jgi:nicotinamide riboside transporter PnuC
MDPSHSARIERMFSRDRTAALVLVALLWLCIGFVYFAVDGYVADGNIRTALMVSALVLLVFNTASMLAMIRHYREDKEHIYGLDIRHLDENRARRQKR